jgi:hypothetical protein
MQVGTICGPVRYCLECILQGSRQLLDINLSPCEGGIHVTSSLLDKTVIKITKIYVNAL